MSIRRALSGASCAATVLVVPKSMPIASVMVLTFERAGANVVVRRGLGVMAFVPKRARSPSRKYRREARRLDMVRRAARLTAVGIVAGYRGARTGRTPEGEAAGQAHRAVRRASGRGRPYALLKACPCRDDPRFAVRGGSRPGRHARRARALSPHRDPDLRRHGCHSGGLRQPAGPGRRRRCASLRDRRRRHADLRDPRGLRPRNRPDGCPPTPPTNPPPHATKPHHHPPHPLPPATPHAPPPPPQPPPPPLPPPPPPYPPHPPPPLPPTHPPPPPPHPTPTHPHHPPLPLPSSPPPPTISTKPNRHPTPSYHILPHPPLHPNHHHSPLPQYPPTPSPPSPLPPPHHPLPPQPLSPPPPPPPPPGLGGGTDSVPNDYRSSAFRPACFIREILAKPPSQTLREALSD